MNAELETALVALSVLAAAPWAIIAGMFLTGRWKVSTQTEAARKGTSQPKAGAARPAATEAFQTVPAPANGSDPAAGAP